MLKILFKHLKGYYISIPEPLFVKIFEVPNMDLPTMRALVLKVFEEELESLDELKLISCSNLTSTQLSHFCSEHKKILQESIFLVTGVMKKNGISQYIIQLPAVETYLPDFVLAKSLLTHQNPGIRQFAKETLGDSHDD